MKKKMVVLVVLCLTIISLSSSVFAFTTECYSSTCTYPNATSWCTGNYLYNRGYDHQVEPGLYCFYVQSFYQNKHYCPYCGYSLQSSHMESIDHSYVGHSDSYVCWY
jgi:hypothetical protein